MPKLGTSIRITSAVAAAALLAVVVAGAASAKPARQAGTTISGAGSTFVAPLVAQWISPSARRYGYDAAVQRRRLRRRHHLDHRRAPSTSARATRR